MSSCCCQLKEIKILMEVCEVSQFGHLNLLTPYKKILAVKAERFKDFNAKAIEIWCCSGNQSLKKFVLFEAKEISLSRIVVTDDLKCEGSKFHRVHVKIWIREPKLMRRTQVNPEGKFVYRHSANRIQTYGPPTESELRISLRSKIWHKFY